MIYTNTENLLIYIRQQMLARKISISQLADKLGKNEKTLAQNFRQKNMSLDLINEICQALDYDIDINLILKGDTTK